MQHLVRSYMCTTGQKQNNLPHDSIFEWQTLPDLNYHKMLAYWNGSNGGAVFWSFKKKKQLPSTEMYMFSSFPKKIKKILLDSAKSEVPSHHLLSSYMYVSHVFPLICSHFPPFRLWAPISSNLGFSCVKGYQGLQIAFIWLVMLHAKEPKTLCERGLPCYLWKCCEKNEPPCFETIWKSMSVLLMEDTVHTAVLPRYPLCCPHS